MYDAPSYKKMKNQYMTQKKKNLSKIPLNFKNIHKKKMFKQKINMTQKKKILLNFMNIHKKKNLKRKINMTQKNDVNRDPILLPHRLHKVLFLRKYTYFDFSFLAEEASRIHPIFKI